MLFVVLLNVFLSREIQCNTLILGLFNVTFSAAQVVWNCE
jgi:hypothetical protein